MLADHVLLFTFALVTLTVTVGGFTLMGWMLWDSHRMVREAQSLTRAVGLLVIQETAKLPGKAGR
jgi:hypothetical protein